MSRYQRTQFFEALCSLQATYAERSDFDRRSVLSIDAIAYAEAVMIATSAEDEEAHAFDEYESQQRQAQSEQQSPALGDPRD
jgi:hypothetical protein